MPLADMELTASTEEFLSLSQVQDQTNTHTQVCTKNKAWKSSGRTRQPHRRTPKNQLLFYIFSRRN